MQNTSTTERCGVCLVPYEYGDMACPGCFGSGVDDLSVTGRCAQCRGHGDMVVKLCKCMMGVRVD